MHHVSKTKLKTKKFETWAEVRRSKLATIVTAGGILAKDITHRGYIIITNSLRKKSIIFHISKKEKLQFQKTNLFWLECM